MFKIDPNRLVFIDESGAKTNMVRLRGRARKGERVYSKAPCGHWCTTTMIGAIRYDGQTACMAIEGATNAEVFRAYVTEVLVPSLHEDDIVILDNLSAHKDRKALEAIEEAGARVMFLPAYSPDLNPIEKMWSKVKQILRSIAARTEDELHRAIAEALALISPEDASGWFQSCGYGFS